MCVFYFDCISWSVKVLLETYSIGSSLIYSMDSWGKPAKSFIIWRLLTFQNPPKGLLHTFINLTRESTVRKWERCCDMRWQVTLICQNNRCACTGITSKPCLVNAQPRCSDRWHFQTLNIHTWCGGNAVRGSPSGRSTDKLMDSLDARQCLYTSGPASFSPAVFATLPHLPTDILKGVVYVLIKI